VVKEIGLSPIGYQSA